MQEQITQLLTKVQDLETLVKFLQTNLSDNIRTFWTILGFLVVSTGGALYFLVKTVVNSRVEKELTDIKCNLEKDLLSYVNTHPFKQFAWASGNATISNDNQLTITGLKISSENLYRVFHIIEVTNGKGRRLGFTYELLGNGLRATLLDFNRDEGINVNWKILWLNMPMIDD
jgi:hypothetical protein